MAICRGLDLFSDHEVRHEPEPRLLEEAFLKHTGRGFRSRAFEDRLRFFRDRAGDRYGESFRAAPLLPDIRAAVPETRFLIIVRPPLEYVLSAHFMRVFRRGDEWDRSRIVPIDLSLEQLSLAEKIAYHWLELNRYLLDFAEGSSETTRVALMRRLEDGVDDWAEHLGVTISDPTGLRALLATSPNASTTFEQPTGFDEERLSELCEPTWERAAALASR